MKKNKSISVLVKRVVALMLAMAMVVLATGCARKEEKKEELTLLCAASLKDVCEELKKTYEDAHKNVTLNFSFGSSGALQAQIEEGAPADIFFSAALKQMNALKEKNLMDESSIKNLLENKVVLVVPKDSKLGLTSFTDVTKDEVKMIGLGDPASVPAGQYAKEVFTNLSIWDEVEKKANYGTDVRTVLNYVELSEVSCGVVYATDAKTGNVNVVAEAPEGSCKKVIYPAGVIASSTHKTAANDFLTFLASDEAMKIFEKYGFARA